MKNRFCRKTAVGCLVYFTRQSPADGNWCSAPFSPSGEITDTWVSGDPRETRYRKASPTLPHLLGCACQFHEKIGLIVCL